MRKMSFIFMYIFTLCVPLFFFFLYPHFHLVSLFFCLMRFLKHFLLGRYVGNKFSQFWLSLKKSFIFIFERQFCCLKIQFFFSFQYSEELLVSTVCYTFVYILIFVPLYVVCLFPPGCFQYLLFIIGFQQSGYKVLFYGFLYACAVWELLNFLGLWTHHFHQIYKNSLLRYFSCLPHLSFWIPITLIFVVLSHRDLKLFSYISLFSDSFWIDLIAMYFNVTDLFLCSI